MPASSPLPHVLAVASGGGHWAELRRLHPAWAGARVSFAVTDAGYRGDLAGDPPNPDGTRPGFFVVPDANADQKLRLLRLALAMAWVVLRTRPDVVITTGAAPGFFALRFGKLMGARTIWVDSIANAEAISKAGHLARPHSDLWLTQWPHLAEETGATHAGAVM